MSRTINDRRGNIIRNTRIHNQYTWSADPVLIAEDLEDPDDIGGASDQRPLHSTGWAMAIPLHKDARWWVRWPSKVVRYVRTRVDRLPRFLYFTLTLSYINLLLIFLPFGIAAHAMGQRAQVIVALNALSLSPLAFLIAFFAEELSSNCSKLVSYLIESLLANAVWLILGMCAIFREQHTFTFIQSAIAGSIISRNFLGIGGAFCTGGIHAREQYFNETLSSTLTSLMMVGFIPFVACKILAEIARKAPQRISEAEMLTFAYGSAIIMLVWYLLFILFRVWTHRDFFTVDFSDLYEVSSDETPEGYSIRTLDSLSLELGNEGHAESTDENTMIEYFPKRFALWSLALALAGTVFVSLALLDGIDGLPQDFLISKTMVAVILLPFLVNLPENVTIILAAYKEQMDQAVLVATSSVIHMNLVIFPVLILLGWMTQQPVNLEFSGPGLAIYGIGVWLTGSVLQDGKSNYLEGLICIALYIIFSMMIYLLPGNV